MKLGLRKASITKKLFIVTTIIFTIFISTTLIIQSLFFEKFYITKKRNDLVSNVEKFKKEYNKAVDDRKVVELIDEYEQSNNLKIIILDNSDKLKSITKNNRTDIFKMRQLTDFIEEWTANNNLAQFRQNNKTISMMTEKRENQSRGLICISPNNGEKEIIFALSSLQPVNEAVGVIKQLYLYFCMGAVFFTAILAFIYSNMITKPLLEISRVATKMAKLDFSEKCIVTTQDEIGNVASSLNFLLDNLSEALNSLKEANTKLEEDIEKERELEKMRKEFIASVSHELKTPISLIDGYAVGLKDEIFENRDKDYYLDIIIDETRKMGGIVSDLLDLSYIESGIFKLELEKFNLIELIKITIRKYETLITEKHINISINLLDQVRVYADWNRMEQVLTNFITNAVRNVNENGEIYLRTVDKGQNISMEIENTGSNIPENEINKIWDKFYKVDKSRNRKLGGTGIGLSIVKNILVLHNYCFGVENTHLGVKFYFMVPKNVE